MMGSTWRAGGSLGDGVACGIWKPGSCCITRDVLYRLGFRCSASGAGSAGDAATDIVGADAVVVAVATVDSYSLVLHTACSLHWRSLVADAAAFSY